MNERTNSSGSEENGFGLLEILAVLIEGWRLLLLVPLSVAMLAFAWVKLAPVPEVYRATVTIAIAGETAEQNLVPQNLSQIVGRASEEDTFPTVTVVPAGTPDTFRITVTGPDRQAVSAALTDIVAHVTDPDSADRGRIQLENRIAATTRRIESLHDAIDEMEGALAKGSQASRENLDSLAYAIDVLSAAALESEVSVSEDQQRLAVWHTPRQLGETQVVGHRQAPGARVIVTFAVLISGLAVVLMLFVRDLWRRARADERNAATFARIRRALRLNS